MRYVGRRLRAISPGTLFFVFACVHPLVVFFYICVVSSFPLLLLSLCLFTLIPNLYLPFRVFVSGICFLWCEYPFVQRVCVLYVHTLGDFFCYYSGFTSWGSLWLPVIRSGFTYIDLGDFFCYYLGFILGVHLRGSLMTIVIYLGVHLWGPFVVTDYAYREFILDS